MSDETDQQTKTVDLRVDRVTPWWLFAYLGAVLVALLFAAIQLRAMAAGLVTLQKQCVAAQASAPAVQPTPATGRANAGKSRISTPAPTAPGERPAPKTWGITDLDRAIARFSTTLQEPTK